IDVNELMDRVRAEAARIGASNPRPRANISPSRAALPRARVLSPPPAATPIRPVEVKKDRLEQLLDRARQRIAAPRWVPKPLRWLFRRQSAYNELVLETLGTLVKTNVLLGKRNRELTTALEAQNRWLHVLAEQRDSESEWMRAAADALEDVARAQTRFTSDVNYLKGELSYQQLRVQRLADGSNGTPSDAPLAGESAARQASEVDTRGLDAFYLNFEDHFRGPRAAIRDKVDVYLPLIEQASAGSVDRPILDVGCGRGEWLDMLREHGRVARGVDMNERMVADCRERGLEATVADAIEHLRSLGDDSLGAVTGFHIIEHLPLAVLLELCAQTRRVLKPGGLVLFESPNCKNLVVGACNFYSDPTHQRPVFPDTAQFMLESHGFERVQIRYVSAAEGSPFDKSDPAGAILDNWFYGPRDFAVIGFKPNA
ncbi:MAG TPA: class I SAM-dependent methyltransferase, partial [Chthoniobacterales bacterium]